MDFAIKYRPYDFKQVIGNDGAIQILVGFLQNKNRPHSFLFAGEYGCGKTTLARIFAKELGCRDLDTIEINSSNNRGIDTAREIIKDCRFKSLSGNDKCYIIDEVHRVTVDWMNAMLKVLEEPPEHVYFMLCTTDSQRLIKTIKSRCVLVNVEKSNVKEILRLLQNVCGKENKNIQRNILKKIAIKSEGHVRDALKLLEKIINIKDEEKILKIIENNIDEENIEAIELCRVLLNGTWNQTKKVLNKLKGQDVEKIRRIILGYMSSVILNSSDKRAALIMSYFVDNLYDSGFSELVLACFNCFF